MKLTSLLLLWVATICVCTAFPFRGSVRTQQVDVDRCAAGLEIQIPMWFCTGIVLEDRPEWLRTICDTIQQTGNPTKVQQVTAGERIVPKWICEIQTDEGRLERINSTCSTILRFKLGKWLGISSKLCDLVDKAERVFAECGSPPNPEERPEEDERPRTFARRRRWTVVDKEVETQQTLPNPVLCSHIANPGELLLVLNTVCGLKENPEDYGIPQTVCDAMPERRIEVLQATCTATQVTGENNLMLQQSEVPPLVCKAVRYPQIQFILKTHCKILPDLPNGICNLPPEERVQAILGRCVATSMNHATAENEQMTKTKIPQWICGSISELSLPKWLNNFCDINDKLPTPAEICSNSEPDA